MKLKNILAAFAAFLLFGSINLLNAQEARPNSKLTRQVKVSMEQATEAASKRVAGKIEKAELEKESGKLIYSFDIRNETGTISEVWVDAQTGEVINVKEENAAQKTGEKRQDKMKGSRQDDDDESEATKRANLAKYAKEAKITMEQAKEIALKRVPGTITDQDLEKERGKLMYSFDIRDANGKVFDVEIDAKTGKVLKAVEDNEDDDNQDDRLVNQFIPR
jgi:uncharacterized membrane protein YkoI